MLIPSRRFAARLALFAAAIALAGCGRRAPEDTPPASGGTLRLAVLEPIDFFSPLYEMNGTTAHLSEHVLPPLGRIDDQGTLRLLLASRFEDRGAWIDFTLRPVRWEDGAPVVPLDFRRTAALLRDPRARSPDRSRVDLVRDCFAVDDSTLRVDFLTIYARRRRDALLQPLPAHRPPWPAGSDSSRDRPYAGPGLSCGPFRVAETRRDGNVLVRHAASGFPPARLDTVVVLVRDPETAVAEFHRGELDAIVDLPATWLPRVRKSGGRAVALVGASYLFVGWNLRDGRFADGAVRRAAAHAVDVPRMLRELTAGQGDRARGPLTALAGFPDTSAVLAYDPRRSIRMLVDAGWRDTDGDGIRDRRGARLEFHLLAPVDDPLRLGAARQVAQDLGHVGIGVRVREIPTPELVQRLQSGQFEAFVGQWFPDAEGGLEPVWRSDATDRLNFVGYANPVADSLLTRLGHEVADDVRRDRLSRFQALVYNDQPCLFLFQNPHVLVLADRVRGAEPQVVSPLWNLPEWWLAPRRP